MDRGVGKIVTRCCYERRLNQGGKDKNIPLGDDLVATVNVSVSRMRNGINRSRCASFSRREGCYVIFSRRRKEHTTYVYESDGDPPRSLYTSESMKMLHSLIEKTSQGVHAVEITYSNARIHLVTTLKDIHSELSCKVGETCSRYFDQVRCV